MTNRQGRIAIRHQMVRDVAGETATTALGMGVGYALGRRFGVGPAGALAGKLVTGATVGGAVQRRSLHENKALAAKLKLPAKTVNWKTALTPLPPALSVRSAYKKAHPRAY